MKRYVLGLIFALFSSASVSGPYWFKTRVAATAVTVQYVIHVECGGLDALGCYREWLGYGFITIRTGLAPYVERCVLEHERRHAEGYDHISGRQAFIDCGDGNWVSAETLRAQGLL